MKRLLARMLDESEFLSPNGVRALSRYHKEHPYVLHIDGQTLTVNYDPAEATTSLYGGNSNWRGPVWMPINYLIIESLRKFHHYYGDDFLIEYPTHSGKHMSIEAVADELAGRVSQLYLKGPQGVRPALANQMGFPQDAGDHSPLLFFEYFHGETGAGLGASHQTGWTALIADISESRRRQHRSTGETREQV